MDNKPIWLRILTDTIGISTLVAIIFGVPAMIVFVNAIWQALNFNQKITTVVSGIILLFSVIWFIYSRTRKKLYIIPNLLYQMHSIAHNHAISINIINDISEKDFLNAYRLIDIDFTNMASLNTVAELRNALDIFYSQNKDKKIPDEDTEYFCVYLMKKSGLLKKLEQDNNYTKITENINHLKLSIPNEDIMETMNKFIKISNSANSVLPLLRMIKMADKDLPEIFTPKIEAASGVIGNNIEDEVATSLTKVRQSIEKYYKGGNK